MGFLKIFQNLQIDFQLFAHNQPVCFGVITAARLYSLSLGEVLGNMTTKKVRSKPELINYQVFRE